MKNVFSSIQEFFPGLYLIDLPQPMEGLRMFISSWFFKDNCGRRVLVDPGPASTIPLLVEQLANITHELDIILVSHVHLDHSGGLGHLLGYYPRAKVLVHPKGHRHLCDPTILWEASLNTLGEVAVMYGKPIPVDNESLMSLDEAGVIESFDTPGHASHHFSFRTSFGGRIFLFAGELAGTNIPLNNGKFWCRPATPPVCNPQIFLDSIAYLRNSLLGDEILCYAHWGAVHGAKERLNLAEKQFRLWLEVVSKYRDNRPERIVDQLLQVDELIQLKLPHDLRIRELSFMKNSVKGLLQGIK